MAYCLQRMRQTPSACLCYESALQAGFESPELHNNLGKIHLGSAKVDLAFEHLQKSIKVKPDLGAAHHHLALAYVQAAWNAQNTKQTSEIRRAALAKALEHQRRAIALLPPTTELWLQSGKVYALAAAEDPQLLEPALDFLKRAQEQGANVEAFNSMRDYRALRSHSGFQQLLLAPR